ncbi:maker151 [Drosophila busckii]|nr:maker151 [Drosophila busckii]
MGEVTLVRYVEDTMWVTFRNGESALSAAAKRSTTVCGLELVFELKTPEWPLQVDNEIELCTSNTIPLCANPAEQAQMVQLTPEVPQRPKQPPTRPAPARPPMPMSPKNSPRHLPHAGVISMPKPAKPPLPPQPMMQAPLQPVSVPPPRPPAMEDNTPSSKSHSPTELGSPLHATSASSSTTSSGNASPIAAAAAAAVLPSGPPTPPRQMQSKQATPVSTPTRQSKQSSLEQQSPLDSAYETASNIYEEIQDDVPAPRHPPPAAPPPVMGQATESPRRQPLMPVNAPMGPPPPLPNRGRGPPPIPNRSGNAPPLPTRPNNN